MAKANTRYVRDIQLNMPDDVISHVITDWLNRNGYSSINYNNGEPNVFVAGDGFVTTKDYVKIFYQNGSFHIESWFKAGKREIGADQPGAYGWAIKTAIKNKIDQFINYLMQQQYIENPQAAAGVQPQPNAVPQGQVPQGNVMNVKGYRDDKAATAPLVIGIILCALSAINLIILLSTGFFLSFGYLFIVLAIFGIVQANKAIKLTDGSSKAKTALVLNIIGCVFVALFLVLGIIYI